MTRDPDHGKLYLLLLTMYLLILRTDLDKYLKSRGIYDEMVAWQENGNNNDEDLDMLCNVISNPSVG